VEIFIRKEHLLMSFDVMLGKSLMRAMHEQGILVHHHVVPARVSEHSGLKSLWATDGREFAGFDCLLWAVGRDANVSGLDLGQAGVALDDCDYVVTDGFQNTNVPGVYAIGDVTGRAALTPVAIAAGRRLSDRVFGGKTDRRLEYSMIPTVVFTHPPIGTVGASEAEARAQYGDTVKVYVADFTPMYHAMTTRKTHTDMKLVCVGPEQRIVGCHVIGWAPPSGTSTTPWRFIRPVRRKWSPCAEAAARAAARPTCAARGLAARVGCRAGFRARAETIPLPARPACPIPWWCAPHAVISPTR
jgi:glutathione reductase (NADPH)